VNCLADLLMLNSFLKSVSDVWKLEQANLLDAISHGRRVNELRDLVANSGEAAATRTSSSWTIYKRVQPA